MKHILTLTALLLALLAKAPGVSALNAAAKTVRLESGHYQFTLPHERKP